MFMFRSSVQDFSLWMRYSRKVPGPNAVKNGQIKPCILYHQGI